MKERLTAAPFSPSLRCPDNEVNLVGVPNRGFFGGFLYELFDHQTFSSPNKLVTLLFNPLIPMPSVCG